MEEIQATKVKLRRKKGTKIIFLEKGCEQLDITLPDLVFNIREKPHPLFT
jgi:hypothetical protein